MKGILNNLILSYLLHKARNVHEIGPPQGCFQTTIFSHYTHYTLVLGWRELHTASVLFLGVLYSDLAFLRLTLFWVILWRHNYHLVVMLVSAVGNCRGTCGRRLGISFRRVSLSALHFSLVSLFKVIFFGDVGSLVFAFWAEF